MRRLHDHATDAAARSQFVRAALSPHRAPFGRLGRDRARDGPGRAQRRAVRVGHEAGLATEVVEGLEAGEGVVVHPPSDLADGVRVRARGE